MLPHPGTMGKEPGVNKLVLVFIGMSKYSNIIGEWSEDIMQSQEFGVLRHDALNLSAMRKAVYCLGALWTSEMSCIWLETGFPKYSAPAEVLSELHLAPAATQARASCNSWCTSSPSH